MELEASGAETGKAEEYWNWHHGNPCYVGALESLRSQCEVPGAPGP